MSPEHAFKVKLRSIVAEIDVEVDVAFVGACEFENTLELPLAIGVGAGRAADDAHALLEGRDQELIRSRIVGQALLREHADLDIDKIGEIADRLGDALEAAHIDDRIKFELGANPGCALSQGAGQNLAGAHVDVLSRKGVLGGACPANGIRVTADFRCGTVEDVRLVEMNVALDEACADECAGEVAFRPLDVEFRPDRGDAPAGDRDVD